VGGGGERGGEELFDDEDKRARARALSYLSRWKRAAAEKTGEARAARGVRAGSQV
jgi:hypothetical protein